MAREKSPDGLLALYEAVCGEPARLSHALKPHDTWRKVLSRIIGKVQGKLLSLAAIAYSRGMSHRAFDEWLRREALPVVDAYVEDAQAQDIVGATRRFFSHLQSLDLPKHFRGRYKRPRPSLLTSGDALLTEYESLAQRCRKVIGKVNRLVTLLDAFPDVPPEVLDRPGRLVPERFAKDALAQRYGCSVRKVVNALREARKARPASPSS